MDETLAGILSRLAVRLNPRARAGFLQLLPAAGRAAVEELVRQGETAGTQPHSLLEQRLFDPLTPPGESEAPPAGEAAAGEATPVQEAPAPGLPVLLALLCAASEPEPAAAFLICLPVHLQGQIALLMARSSSLNITRGLDREEAELAEALRQNLGNQEQLGLAAAVRLLRAIPEAPHLRRILTAADQLDHQTIAILQNHLFVFEDLLRLGDPDLQNLLLQVDNATLAKSLMMTEEQVRNRLLRNVSQRRRVSIEEAAEQYAHATLAEIEGAQLAILNLVRLLYEQGRITAYFGLVAREERALPPTDRTGEEPGGEAAPQEPRSAARTGWGSGKRVAFLVLVLGLMGAGWLAREAGLISRSTAPGAVPQGQGGRGSRGSAMRVVIQGLEEEAGSQSGMSGGEERSLDIGGTVRTPGGVRAVLELPDYGIFELDELTEVERPAPEEAKAEAEGLYLRVGQVRTTIVEDGFPICTPVVKLAGSPGAIFRTRVVLDASTLVEVEQGQVEVVSLIVPDRRWTLRSGDKGRFDSRGKGDIQSREEAGNP